MTTNEERAGADERSRALAIACREMSAEAWRESIAGGRAPFGHELSSPLRVVERDEADRAAEDERAARSRFEELRSALAMGAEGAEDLGTLERGRAMLTKATDELELAANRTRRVARRAREAEIEACTTRWQELRRSVDPPFFDDAAAELAAAAVGALARLDAHFTARARQRHSALLEMRSIEEFRRYLTGNLDQSSLSGPAVESGWGHPWLRQIFDAVVAALGVPPSLAAQWTLLGPIDGPSPSAERMKILVDRALTELDQ